MREQLITVPSCDLHNNEFSAYDERCKIYIQGISNSKIAFEMFEQKTKRGLNRVESTKFRENLLKEFEIIDKDEIYINAKSINEYFEKIIKGLYFYHYAKLLFGDLISFISNDLNDNEKFKESLNYFTLLRNKDVFKKGKCNNPEIFYYEFGIIEGFFYTDKIFYKDVRVLSIFKITN